MWFLSAGIDGDPAGDVAVALAERSAQLAGAVVAVIGPRPANSIAFPSAGLSLGLAFRDYPGGVDEYVNKVADVSSWS